MKFGVHLAGNPLFFTYLAKGYFEYKPVEKLGIPTGLKLQNFKYLLQLQEETEQKAQKNLYH